MGDFQNTDPLIMQLLDEDRIDEAQAQEVVEEHERTGKAMRTVVVDLGLLAEDEVLEAISNYLSVDLVDLMGSELDQETLRAIPSSVARMYNVVPVGVEGDSITLATCDLLSPQIVDDIAFVLTKTVELVIADEESIDSYLDKHYGDDSESVRDMLSELESELENAESISGLTDTGGEVLQLEQMANQTPVIKFVNLVLYQAVQDRASDVHFEPFEDDFKIRYRVDGALYEMAPPPKHLALPVTSRLKVMSGLNIAERRLPQDGRVQLKIGGRTVDFRVSTLPTQFGESVVMRILDRSNVSLDLENIGMPDDIFNDFTMDISKPNGIVVVTGPTGSGKTTTLYSALRRLNKIESKLLTAEEPVEYDIDGLIQVPVNEAIGVTFGRALRAFLRQDPDIIMVGEIRDLETSEISIQASLTGHLVFSTLHTNDAAGAITRLIDMGVEPFLIASTLEGVLGQRLVRTICSQCRTPYKPDQELLDRLNITQNDVGDRDFYYGEGCEVCNNTGYKGRRGIYEYLRINNAIRGLINERKPTVIIRDKAVEMGMRTLRHDGIRCILDGYTTVEEVLKYT